MTRRTQSKKPARNKPATPKRATKPATRDDNARHGASIRFPSWLLDEIDKDAENMGISRNAWVVMVCRLTIQSRDAAMEAGLFDRIGQDVERVVKEAAEFIPDKAMRRRFISALLAG